MDTPEARRIEVFSRGTSRGLVGEFLLVVSNLLIRVLVLGLSGRKLKRIQ